MNEVYKICVFKCFHKSDVIKLTSFSTNNLIEVTSVNTDLNLSRKYFSYCSLKYLFC